MTSNHPVSWAILGTGAVSDRMARALTGLGCRVVVVASRRAERADEFARRHGARAAGYADAVADPGVAAVYVATPPSEHEQHAMMAVAAGKAVLIEKPFASDAAAARRIAEAAAAAGVFCMEAMWTRFQPLLVQIRARIAAGEIGEVRQFHGSFCVAAVVDQGASVFDHGRGGGALMHRGIYPLSLARYLVGPVSDVQAVARTGSTGVDEDCAITLRHDNGALSVLRASLSSTAPADMVIQGTAGTIRASGPIYRPTGAQLHTTAPPVSRGRAGGLREDARIHAIWQRVSPVALMLRPGGRRIRAPYAGTGYVHQLEAVIDALSVGQTQSPLMPTSESVEIMGLVDTARSRWGAR